jgi:hypothetical protein
MGLLSLKEDKTKIKHSPVTMTPGKALRPTPKRALIRMQRST